MSEDQITKSDIRDWCIHPITKWFLDHLNEMYLDSDYMNVRTIEALFRQHGRMDVMNEIKTMLSNPSAYNTGLEGHSEDTQ